MAGRSTGGVERPLQTLLDHGAFGGLSDARLLERFVAGRDGEAEAAQPGTPASADDASMTTEGPAVETADPSKRKRGA